MRVVIKSSSISSLPLKASPKFNLESFFLLESRNFAVIAPAPDATPIVPKPLATLTAPAPKAIIGVAPATSVPIPIIVPVNKILLYLCSARKLLSRAILSPKIGGLFFILNAKSFSDSKTASSKRAIFIETFSTFSFLDLPAVFASSSSVMSTNLPLRTSNSLFFKTPSVVFCFSKMFFLYSSKAFLYAFSASISSELFAFSGKSTGANL